MRIELPQVLLAKVSGSQARETRCGDTSPFLAVAIHLREEGCIAEPARISVNGRWLFEWAARIRDAKLIDDGSVPQALRGCLAIGAVGYWHDCSIAPTQHSFVMAGERGRVSSDQVVERRASPIILREKRSPAREHCERDDQANLRHDPVIG
jgi:hypothetical protein